MTKVFKVNCILLNTIGYSFVQILWF